MKRKLFLIISLFALTLALTACGDKNKEITRYEGIVQDKHFQKGGVSTGTGISMSGNLVVTTNSTPDKYVVFIDDEVYDIHKKDWLRIDKGQRISYELGWGEIVNVEIIE